MLLRILNGKIQFGKRFAQEVKHSYHLPNNSTVGIYSREITTECTQKACMWIFRAKSDKQSKCPLTYEWIKENVVHPYSRVSFSNKKEMILVHITTCMNFENSMLSEESQSQKATYYIIPIIWNVQKKQVHWTGVDQWLPSWKYAASANGYKVSS